MTQPLDTSILDRFESLAHALQRTVGIHPLQLTAIADMVMGTCIILWMIQKGSHISFSEKLFGVFVVLYVLYTVSFSYPKARKKLLDIVKNGGRNPHELSPVTVVARIVALCVCSKYFLEFIFSGPTNTEQVSTMTFWAACTISLYFLSVTPLPSRRA